MPASRPAGATGGTTLWEGVKAIASGYSDCVLCMGWERMDEVPTDEGNFYIYALADRTGKGRSPHLYRLTTPSWRRRLEGLPARKRIRSGRTMAEDFVKHQWLRADEPYAHGAMKITGDYVLKSPVIAHPLRALDACLMSGSARPAGFSATRRLRAKLTKNSRTSRSDMGDRGLAHPAAGGPARHGDSAPAERDQGPVQDFGKKFPAASAIRFTGFLAARMAAYYAYNQVGIKDPMEDLDVIELHDAFTISDIQTYEDIGLRPYGYGRD